MPPKLAAPRKRIRKRKRRAASSSESSSSSSSSSDSEPETKTRPAVAKAAPTVTAPVESESESSSSSSDSDSDESDAPPSRPNVLAAPAQPQAAPVYQKQRSPSLPPAPIPSFLPSKTTGDGGDAARDQERKEKFRRFWMSTIADGFKDDLEEIRKEPNQGTSRLALLIDSLASGADVFASSAQIDNSDIKEMEVVLQ